VLAALRLLLKGAGYRTEAANSPNAVLAAIRKRRFDVVLIDLNYTRDTTSGKEGLDLISRIQDEDNSLPIVVMTAWGSVDLAVEAMRRGVRDFVQSPGRIRACCKFCGHKSSRAGRAGVCNREFGGRQVKLPTRKQIHSHSP
jgi:DNA-binding NtrC family response regulator